MTRTSRLDPRQRAKRCKSPSALRNAITCAQKRVDDAVTIGWHALAESWTADLEHLQLMPREMQEQRRAAS